MRGPYLITALPDDLSGLTYELVTALHRAVMTHGRTFPEDHLAYLSVRLPKPVFIAASTLPDQLKLSIRRMHTQIVTSADLTMVFLTADSHNYVLLTNDVRIEELQRIAGELGGDPSP